MDFFNKSFAMLSLWDVPAAKGDDPRLPIHW